MRQADGYRWLRRYAPIAIAFATYAALRLSAIGLGSGSGGTSLFPGWSVVAVALGTYLWKLVVPLPLNAYIAELPGGAGFVAASALGIAAVVAFSAVAARRGWRPTVALLVWIAAGIAPSLAILVKLPEVPVAERYLYFPSVGFCLLAGQLAALALVQRRAAVRWTVAAAAVAILVSCTVIAARRNRVWESDRRLWTDTTAKSPTAGLPLRSLAVVLQNAGQTDEARVMYERALEKHNTVGGRITIYNNLGSMVLLRGDLDTAERYYRQALAIQETPDCVFNLGVISLTRAREAGARGDEAGRRREAQLALPLLEKAERTSPHDPDIQVALGQSLSFLGKHEEARRHYERALSLGISGATADQIRSMLVRP